jgi:Flp pilus assembly protein TadB
MYTHKSAKYLGSSNNGGMSAEVRTIISLVEAAFKARNARMAAQRERSRETAQAQQAQETEAAEDDSTKDAKTALQEKKATGASRKRKTRCVCVCVCVCVWCVCLAGLFATDHGR